MAETLFDQIKLQHERMSASIIGADIEYNWLLGRTMPLLLAVVEAASNLEADDIKPRQGSVAQHIALRAALAPLFEESE